jgi:DNA modification methylase
MNIEEVRIDEISNHPTNPKIHPDNQIRLLQKSIKRFGYTAPVILSADGVILAGHARVKAAIELGQDTVPCIRTKLTGDEADAYLLADNRLSDIAPYDRDILAELLSDLPKDLAEITGFDQVQVDALLSGEDIPDIDKFISDSQPEESREEVDAEPQIDRAAELNEKWQVKTGDLWQLGDHRLICGDCTDPAVVERVMMGEKADLIFTDPPYNCGDEMSDSFYANCDSPAMKALTKAKWDEGFDPLKFLSVLSQYKPENGTVYICTSHQLADNYWRWATKEKASHSSYVVWCKPNPMPSMAMRHYTWATELIIYATFGKHIFNFDKGHHCLNWWEIAKNSANKMHPTQKPVEVPKHAIEYSSAPGGIVLDFFLGSGTTLIACENTGRKCRGIEISPEYVSVCLQRFKDATGKEPVRINE